jgi:hypothetical protein
MTRQKTDRRGTASDGRLFHLAQEAMLLAWKRRIRVGRLRLMADRLAEPPAQLELFPEDESLPTDREPLWTALDQIRSRYGRGVIRTGRSLVEAA